MMKRKDINAFILAGGKSSRMGTNKALLKINGCTIIDVIAGKLNYFFEDIAIISNSPEDYSLLNYKVYQDIYPGLGPLSGIHSALYNSNTENNFIISCDLPLISKELIEFLLHYNSDKEIIIPAEKENLQPLCGLYKNSCLAEAEELLKLSMQKDHKLSSVYNLINKKSAEIVEVTKFKFYSQHTFFNLNTLNDLTKLRDLESLINCIKNPLAD